jgi:N-acetylated-alpha-linked acidic dipeptidase
MEKYNRQVFQSERSFISEQGLPGRPWFRHELYAPGLYTGYGVKTMPGIREAIEEEHWEQAQQQIDIMTATLNRYSDELQMIIDLTTEK